MNASFLVRRCTKLGGLMMTASIGLAQPARADVANGLTQLIQNITTLLTTTLGSSIVLILIILSAIYTAWHNHWGWMVTVFICGSIILGASWYEQTFYGVSAPGG